MIYSKKTKSIASFNKILRMAKFFDVMYKFSYEHLYSMYNDILNGYGCRIDDSDGDTFIIHTNNQLIDNIFIEHRGYTKNITCAKYVRQNGFFGIKTCTTINCMNTTLELQFLALFISVCDDYKIIEEYLKYYKTDQFDIQY